MTLHHTWAPAPLHRAAEALAAAAGLSHTRAMFDLTFLVGLAAAFGGFALAALAAGRVARVGFGRTLGFLAPSLVPVSFFSGLSHSVHVLLTQVGNAASAALTQAGVAVYLAPALVSPPVADALRARGTGPLWWLTAAGYAFGLLLAWRGAAALTVQGGSAGKGR